MEEMTDDMVRTSVTWRQTQSGDGSATWDRMDKKEHIGYLRERSEDYEGDDKFAVFKDEGLRSNCRRCGGTNTHLVHPDQFLGYAATEYEAAKMVFDYCEDAADEVEWSGKAPIYRRGAMHPRAEYFFI